MWIVDWLHGVCYTGNGPGREVDVLPDLPETDLPTTILPVFKIQASHLQNLELKPIMTTLTRCQMGEIFEFPSLGPASEAAAVRRFHA